MERMAEDGFLHSKLAGGGFRVQGAEFFLSVLFPEFDQG